MQSDLTVIELTQKELKRILYYEEDTGLFIWKYSTGMKSVRGDVAGGFSVNGYIVIGIYGKSYRANILAWFYKNGYWPEGIIDHKDRIRHNNRWCNLREISHQCSVRNRNTPCNNISGIVGVSWCKINNKWKVSICVNYKRKYLGMFSNKTEAVAHRLAAEQCLEWENCDERSSAYCYIENDFKEVKCNQI